MITCKQDYLRYLERDKTALGRTGTPPLLTTLDPVWTFQRLLRTVEYFSNCKSSWLWRPYIVYLKYAYMSMGLRLGFHIPLNAIGPGLYITHTGPIIMAANTRIGSDLRINVGVVIGYNLGTDNVPSIGNNVVIEPGAKIFGKIIIADWVHIGANAVVNRSFTEPGIMIAGVPAKKIKDNQLYPGTV